MTRGLAPLMENVAALTGWRRWLCALIAGAVAALALAPVHAVPLLALSFPCLVLLLDGCDRPRAAFATGWWFGFGHFTAGLYWLANAFLVDAETFAWLIPLAVLVLPAVLALFTGATLAAARLMWPAGSRRVLVLALAWCAGEWLRGHAFTGLPWNLTGYVWAFSDAMMQTTAVVGTYGLSLLTVAMAAAPAALSGPSSSRFAGAGFAGAGFARWRPVMAAAALGAVLFAGGAARLAWTETTVVPDVTLRLVQANIPQKQKWMPAWRRRNFVRHMTMSEIGKNRPKYLIWPETAVPYFIDTEPSRLALIARVLQPGGLVLTGAVRLRRGDNGEYRLWNSFHAIDGGGNILATYDKSHLVPFGEYLPFRWLLERLGLASLSAGDTDFSPGPGMRSLRLPGLPPVGVLICYEAIFPGAVVDPDDRPDWLLNITNDAWYGNSAGPYQHFAMTRARAIEQGIPIVRAAGTGISAVVDPLGRVLHRLGLGKRGIVDSELPGRLAALPPYAVMGDWALLLLIAVTAGLVLALGRLEALSTPRKLT